MSFTKHGSQNQFAMATLLSMYGSQKAREKKKKKMLLCEMLLSQLIGFEVIELKR